MIEPERLLERIVFHESGHCCAAIVFNIPIVSVSINVARPHVLRGRYRPLSLALGLETLVTFCLSGVAAETFYVGPVTDGSDATDLAMARQYLARHLGPLQVEAEIVRCRAAGDRLVKMEERRIKRIADALLKCGILSGDAILELGLGFDS